MGWRLLVVRKALLEWFPAAGSLRELKRRWFGYHPVPDNMRTTVENFRDMKSAAADAGGTFAGATVLEIGSGWFPVIPLTLCSDGARQVLMTDLNRHMDDVTFRATVQHLCANFTGYEALRPLQSMGELPLRYLAPFDAAQVDDASLDYVISRTVLEHIEPGALASLMAALRPKLKPGGLMIHLIDHSDHLQHQDRSISRINFLAWSPALHAVINRLIGEGENRMRHHEYRPLFVHAGYQVVSERTWIDPDCLRGCETLALAPPYDTMTPEQLSTIVSIYVLRAA